MLLVGIRHGALYLFGTVSGAIHHSINILGWDFGGETRVVGIDVVFGHFDMFYYRKRFVFVLLFS